MSAATTSAAPATPAKATALPLGTPAAYAAEVLGTFVLVLFIILAVSGTAPEPFGTGNFDIVLIAFTHAIVLFVLIRSLGAASGAHFNPAVTVALLFKGKIGPSTRAPTSCSSASARSSPRCSRGRSWATRPRP